MDTFVPSQLIENRIGEFKTELPSAEEIDAFYSLAKIEEPSDRPYAWSNTISSLDGVVSVGQGYSGVKLVGLKNLPNSKSRTDFRLLASGTFVPPSPFISRLLSLHSTLYLTFANDLCNH